MAIAKVIEVSASSTSGFEDAVRDGINRAAKTVHNMRTAWVNEQSVVVRDDQIVEWHVNLRITFVLDD
jgi:flavin-binding protein dodecin